MAALDRPILDARDLVKAFGGGRWSSKAPLVAVDNVSLRVVRSEAVGVVGESGSGKSTLARMLVGLIEPTGGEISVDGVDARKAGGAKALRAAAQFVFQDAASAFNPRRTIGESLEAPMVGLTSWDQRRRSRRVFELLELVGLAPEHRARRPHEFSGGQLQRAAIARALAPEPKLLVLDEPVSALDVSIQAQILALLKRLRAETGLTMVFVSHDLAVVERLCDRVAVMRRGRIVEQGACRKALSTPRERYTRELVAAARVVVA